MATSDHGPGGPRVEAGHRKRTQRAVLVVLVIFLVVVVTWAAIQLQSNIGVPAPPTALSSVLQLGPASATRNGSDWRETIGILHANISFGLYWLALGVRAAGNASLEPPGGAVVDVVTASNLTVAEYSMSNSTWSAAPSFAGMATGETLVLVWPSASVADPLAGDRLVVEGVGGFVGSISVWLA